jgi:hypothetical protein
MDDIKCCKQPMTQSMYYRYRLCSIHCQTCHKHRDIDIPDHIPYNQFSYYIVKKYHELVKDENAWLERVIKRIKENDMLKLGGVGGTGIG